MNFALIYLANRVLYRLGDFFHHWYVHGSRNLIHRFVSILEDLDRTIALRVTFRHLFQPLYKDYTIVGRILGLVFRPMRILIGLVVYAFLAVLFLMIYLAWLLIPPILIIYAASNL